MSELDQIRPSELNVLMIAAELSLIRGLKELELEKSIASNPSNSSDPSTPSIPTPTKDVGSVDDISVRYKV